MKKLVSRLALFALLLSALGLAGSSSATAGTYEFQATCYGTGNPSEPMKVSSPNFFHVFGPECDVWAPHVWGAGQTLPFGIMAGGGWTQVAWLNQGDSGWVGYDLGPGARFTKVNSLTYQNKNHSNMWSALRIQGGTHNYPLVAIPPVSSTSGTLTNVAIPPSGQGPRLQAIVECNSASCHGSEEGHALIVGRPKLTIEDFTAPVAVPTGNIISSTPVSGIRSVAPLAVDGNSGVYRLVGLVNAQIAFVENASCNTNRLQPCPNPFTPSINVDTTASPWVEGNNTFNLCAMDFSQNINTANAYCSESYTVRVDN